VTTYVLTNGSHVIGVGPTTRICRRCGPAIRVRGGFQIDALNDPSGLWTTVEFTCPESARAYLQNRPGYYETYRPVRLEQIWTLA
jgi:hypothetical protein